MVKQRKIKDNTSKVQHKGTMLVTKLYHVYNRKKNIVKHSSGVLFRLSPDSSLLMNEYENNVTINGAAKKKQILNNIKGLIQIEFVTLQKKNKVNGIVHSTKNSQLLLWNLECINQPVITVNFKHIHTIVCLASKTLYKFTTRTANIE